MYGTTHNPNLWVLRRFFMFWYFDVRLLFVRSPAFPVPFALRKSKPPLFVTFTTLRTRVYYVYISSTITTYGRWCILLTYLPSRRLVTCTIFTFYSLRLRSKVSYQCIVIFIILYGLLIYIHEHEYNNFFLLIWFCFLIKIFLNAMGIMVLIHIMPTTGF